MTASDHILPGTWLVYDPSSLLDFCSNRFSWMKTTSIRILKLEVPDTRYEELRDFRHVDHHIVTCVNVREYLVSLVPKRQGQEMKEHVSAVEVGTEMLEIDCHLTRDGQVVVSHDNDLRRVTGLNVRISETPFHDLPILKQSLSLDFHQKHTTRGGEDRQIPLLRDVFETFPETPINIDIKMDDDELIHKVAELIKTFNREELTVWGNRNSIIINKLYKTSPEIPIFFSLKKVLYTTVLFYTGILPFVPVKETFFEIPMLSILRRRDFRDMFSWKFRTLLRICDFLLTSKVLFSHLQRRGIQVYLWVLNEEHEFERAFHCGATGVMTDFPTKLSDFLKEHPEIATRNTSS